MSVDEAVFLQPEFSPAKYVDQLFATLAQQAPESQAPASLLPALASARADIARLRAGVRRRAAAQANAAAAARGAFDAAVSGTAGELQRASEDFARLDSCAKRVSVVILALLTFGVVVFLLCSLKGCVPWSAGR